MSEGELKKRIFDAGGIDDFCHWGCEDEDAINNIIDEAKKELKNLTSGFNIVQTSGEKLDKIDLENVKLATFEITGKMCDWIDKWFGDSK